MATPEEQLIVEEPNSPSPSTSNSNDSSEQFEVLSTTTDSSINPDSLIEHLSSDTLNTSEPGSPSSTVGASFEASEASESTSSMQPFPDVKTQSFAGSSMSSLPFERTESESDNIPETEPPPAIITPTRQIGDGDSPLGVRQRRTTRTHTDNSLYNDEPSHESNTSKRPNKVLQLLVSCFTCFPYCRNKSVSYNTAYDEDDRHYTRLK